MATKCWGTGDTTSPKWYDHKASDMVANPSHVKPWRKQAGSCNSCTCLSTLVLHHRKKFWFQTQLSVTLHGLTRSREILHILRKFSLGISYKFILHLYESWAKHDLLINDTYPEKLVGNIPGIGILDNDDFCKETLTGADMSHRTSVMFV